MYSPVPLGNQHLLWQIHRIADISKLNLDRLTDATQYLQCRLAELEHATVAQVLVLKIYSSLSAVMLCKKLWHINEVRILVEDNRTEIKKWCWRIGSPQLRLPRPKTSLHAIVVNLPSNGNAAVASCSLDGSESKALIATVYSVANSKCDSRKPEPLSYNTG